MSRPARYLAVLLPPLAFALLKPDIFLSALDYAGTYGVMSLFGVLPAVLAWRQRYGSGEGTVEEARRMQVNERSWVSAGSKGGSGDTGGAVRI